MTKKIDTLVDDIKDVLSNPQNHHFDTDVLDQLGKNITSLVYEKLANRPKEYNGGALRMSAIGQPDRKMWYQEHMPEKAEPMPPEAYLKFLYGDIIEELILMLAKVAGHTVSGEQKELDIDGVKGHQDCEIDGELVDIKSASSFAFNKFNNHDLEHNDPFHYLDQLNSYLSANGDVEPSRAHFFAVDKQLGKMCLDTYERNDKDYSEVIAKKRKMLAKDEPPGKCYFPVKDGMSGNMKLDTQCSYCAFKRECWGKNLSAWAYASGPRFLTELKKVPNVPRIY